MNTTQLAMRWMALETGSLERRLANVPRFADTIPMVGAAAPSHSAVCLADIAVEKSRRVLGHELTALRKTLERGRDSELRSSQRRYLGLRMQFSRLLGTVDIFSDALTQRAEHGVGSLLRGLDQLARDGISARAPAYRPPPLVCYLDDSVAGGGGAIRRAFTRLPGGETNAVGLIKLPRERLLGSGLASLLHEVGHQGVASLGLLPEYREAIAAETRSGGLDEFAGDWWSRKLSEVLADLWAVAKLGMTATLGLFAVLGRSPFLTYHDVIEDPHPAPWLRALASAAFGDRIMPHAAWDSLRRLWLTLYPLSRAPATARSLLDRLLPTLERVTDIIARVRPAAFAGATFAQAIGVPHVHPARLLATLPSRIAALRRNANALSPCRTLAVIGVARHGGVLGAKEEYDLLSRELKKWASGVVCDNGQTNERGGLYE